MRHQHHVTGSSGPDQTARVSAPLRVLGSVGLCLVLLASLVVGAVMTRGSLAEARSGQTQVIAGLPSPSTTGNTREARSPRPDRSATLASASAAVPSRSAVAQESASGVAASASAAAPSAFGSRAPRSPRPVRGPVGSTAPSGIPSGSASALPSESASALPSESASEVPSESASPVTDASASSAAASDDAVASDAAASPSLAAVASDAVASASAGVVASDIAVASASAATASASAAAVPSPSANAEPVVSTPTEVTLDFPSFTVNLSDNVTDADGDDVTFTIASGSTCDAAGITAAGTASGEFPGGVESECTIDFTMSDGVNTGVPGSVTIEYAGP